MTPQEMVDNLNQLPKEEGEEPIYIPEERLAQLAKQYPPPQWWYDSPEEDLF